MRLQFLAIIGLVLSSCTSLPEAPSTPMRSETVRLEQTGELSLRAGDYVDTSGFVFVIGFEEDAQDLSTPNSVSWSIGFRNYCRDRPSWVRSIVKGPSGQIWGGYPAFVPAGPDHPQHWSSGSSGSEEYGGPATPGILEAITQGGQFILAVEDDEGPALECRNHRNLDAGGQKSAFCGPALNCAARRKQAGRGSPT
jgi:hypothetical protein